VLTQSGKLTTISGSQSTGQLGRGYNDDIYCQGDLAEVLVYGRALSEDERLQVERYLQQKYEPSDPQPGTVTAPSYDESYAYNAIGNLTSKAGVSYTYPASGVSSVRPHTVSSVGGQSYSYDNNGNMLSGGGRSMTWDAANRPLTVTSGGVTETYSDDGDGARVTTTSGGVTTVDLGGVLEQAGGGGRGAGRPAGPKPVRRRAE
jgi:hypothetical protein